MESQQGVQRLLRPSDRRTDCFLTDFIWIPANGLERFWEVYQLYPDALVTGVGHKAQDGLEGISETDERVFGEPGVHETDFTWYELNWASCPTKIAPRFDEAMDEFYGGENQVFAMKAVARGHKIYLDRSNVCIGLNQAQWGRPTDWEEKHHNKENRIAERVRHMFDVL